MGFPAGFGLSAAVIERPVQNADRFVALIFDALWGLPTRLLKYDRCNFIQADKFIGT